MLIQTQLNEIGIRPDLGVELMPFPEVRPSLSHTLAKFSPISLAEMEDVALLRRMDTKLVLREEQLIGALAHLSDDYEVLEITGRRIHRYQTLYFDTPEYALYYQHHNGHGNRYKVRARTYMDSGLAFLEVKHKTNQGITIKERLRTPELMLWINPRGSDFLATHFPYPAESLTPTLWNHFRRVTLVSKHRAERLTLDIGLSFRVGQREIALPGLAIAEVKQSAYSLRSEFIGQLRMLGIRPMSFSKYCIGVSLLVPHIKHNRFKPYHLWLNRMLKEKNYN
ncbi:MAG: polyphosphate polymerase domain-containing protein [Anaerolineae bacterium]|nr:polyphosphate polymerase domain-containing protein [Anaerolineae bacterium]